MTEFLAREREVAARQAAEARDAPVPLGFQLVSKRRRMWLVLPWAFLPVATYVAMLMTRLVWPNPGFSWVFTVLPLANVLFVVGHLRVAAEVRRVRKRIVEGYCRHCGDDLRETPGKCPECGQDPPPAELVAAAKSDAADGASVWGTGGQPVRLNRWVVVGLILIVAAPLAFIGADAYQRHRRESAVAAFSARVAPTLASDPRFRSVQVQGYAALQEVDVYGLVDSDADQVALKAAVDAAEPPYPVKWQTTVLHLGPSPSGGSGGAATGAGRP